jgi:DNA replication protein DnaC
MRTCREIAGQTGKATRKERKREMKKKENERKRRKRRRTKGKGKRRRESEKERGRERERERKKEETRLKESALPLKAEFHLAITCRREILPQSRGATPGFARSINNVLAGPRNFGAR